REKTLRRHRSAADRPSFRAVALLTSSVTRRRGSTRPCTFIWMARPSPRAKIRQAAPSGSGQVKSPAATPASMMPCITCLLCTSRRREVRCRSLLRIDSAQASIQSRHPSGEAVGEESRSEEHTSELQSRENLVCRLLLEKKKIKENHKCTVC